MLSYLKKFALDILPSVAATIIGAYIVNHYIVGQARTGRPGGRSGLNRDAGARQGVSQRA